MKEDEQDLTKLKKDQIKMREEKEELEMQHALWLSGQEEQIKMREEKEELEMQHALWLSGTAELTKGILSEQEQRDTEIMNHALCVLCLGTFVNPTQITCGHTFCADCLQHLCNAPLLEGQNVGRKPCPTCRVDFDTNTNYAVNVEFRNQIEHMNNNNNNANQ